MLGRGTRKELPSLRRRALEDDTAGWVRQEPPIPGATTPLAMTPLVPGIDLAVWARRNLPSIRRGLHAHGAVLLRGFGVTEAAAFERVVRALVGEPLPYEERSSPRSAVSGHVYTSTDHPPSLRIFLHNEQSYNLVFPLHLLFCCVTPAPEGGATPIADARGVFRRVPKDIRARFIERGYAYVRNFGDRFGLPWQEVFGTGDRAEVEAYCRRNGIGCEWRDGGRLRTRQVRRVTGLHPVTGEPVWFNHATFFHVSTLPAEIGDALRAALRDDELPNNTFYGDGAPIEPEVLSALREAYDAERIESPWQRGDVLLTDNMLVSHGRAPFAGPRLVLVAMATPFAWSAVPDADADADVAHPASPSRQEAVA